MRIACVDFHLSATLESGQVFGFNRLEDGSYEGTLAGHFARFSQPEETQSLQVDHDPKRLSLQGAKMGSGKGLETESPRGLSEGVVRDYFDLDRDLRPLFSVLENEKPLAASLGTFRGLRLIRQDPWQALACFILSSNNNVKRIQHIWRNLETHYSGFPSAEDIARTHERTLRQLGLGYRAPFLSRTGTFLATNPYYLDAMRTCDYDEARSRALAFPGIGPKVADCVLLYGFHRLDAFPVDIWILRAMRKHYFGGRRVSEQRVHTYGRKRWGALAGYVQQYLFHGARNGVIY
jgi:N-glycosylase/DNA lyase